MCRALGSAHRLGGQEGGAQMTRVLVVHHDIDLGDQEADSLRRRGYEVEQCSGPSSYACPVLRGEECPAVERADVLLYDVWSTTETGGSRALIAGLRELHPDIPIVLTAPGIELDWVETEGARKVVPLVGVVSAERLDAAIREALGQPAETEAVPAAT
jgi:DNA-binding NtrC family response regulator